MMQTNNLSIKIDAWSYGEWVEAFLKPSVTEPMCEDRTMLFMKLCLMEQSPPLDRAKFENRVQNDLEEHLGWRIIRSHCNRFNLNLTTCVKLLILDLCASPGSIVMYLAAIRWVQLNNGIAQITIDEFSKLFPRGFVKENELSRLWDMQKIPSGIRREKNYNTDNYLDII